MLERTERPRLACRFCLRATIHEFAHEQIMKERVKRKGSSEIEETVDLWYKCQTCGRLRRWGHELVGRSQKAS